MDTSPEVTPVGRPTSLTIACVMVFIFAGWSLISNLMEAINPPSPEQVQAAMEESMGMMSGLIGDNEEAAEMVVDMQDAMLRMTENARSMALTKALAAAMAIFGAFLMWKLQRKGFMMYVAGGVLWALAAMMFGGVNMITIATFFMYGFVVLIFTILFGVNRKFMV